MRGFRLRLNAKQRNALRRAERSHPSPRVRGRARLVLACAKASSLLQVAHRFDCSWRTVKAAVHRYQTDGLAGLADAPRPGRPPQVKPPVRQQLTQALQAQPQLSGLPGYRWTAKRVRRYLARQHTRVSLTTAWRELARCDQVRRRGKHYTPSPDPHFRQKKGRSTALAEPRDEPEPVPSGTPTSRRSSSWQ